LDNILAYTLVKNGYIGEDYLDYISIFYEGSITRNDYQFLISLKNQAKLENDYKLNKIDKLISKINVIDFSTSLILNYDLVDHLLENNSIYESHIQSIFTLLKDESESSSQFIFGYIESSKKVDIFFNLLCRHWVNIWNYVDNNPSFLYNYKTDILRLILEFSDVESIKEILQHSNLRDRIENDSEFLSIITKSEKLKQIIMELTLVFKGINFEKSPDDLLLYIYENDFYELNVSLVNGMIKKFGNLNQVAFDNSNFLAIKSSGCDQLINYINEYAINDYIENVYLAISTNVNEDETTLVELLNHNGLNDDLKKSIIKKVKTRITDLNSLTDRQLYSDILIENKAIPTWENLLIEYNDQSNISESIINFINIKDNAEILSKIKIPIKVGEVNIFADFTKNLLETDDINDESYQFLINSCPWQYDDIDFEKLSQEKIILLVDNLIIEPNKQTYDLLKETYIGLNIIHLENNIKEFLKIKDELNIDKYDLERILKSTKLEDDEKNNLLNSCSEDMIISNSEILKQISLILVNNYTFKVSDNIIQNLLLNTEVSSTNRIIIYNRYHRTISISSLTTFLTTLSDSYAEIANHNKKAVLENNQVNKTFLDILCSKGYISTYTERGNGLRINHKRKF
jgi:hypothetical protein